MGLINLQTDLKSLKFGNDRFGGGSSNQPYIQTPIPDGVSALGNQNTDFILRGGILSPILAAFDAARLTKYMFDIKSPAGLLFTTKQNLLSLQNVKSVGFPANSNLIPSSINGGIYLPTNTIAQALVNPLGIHLPKQGLLPIPPSDQEKYFYITKDLESANHLSNRLTLLFKTKIENSGSISNKTFGVDSADGSGVLLKYSGGPNSVGGFGNTIIRITNPTLPKSGSIAISFPTGKYNGATVTTYQIPISSSIKFIDGEVPQYTLLSGSYVSNNYANSTTNFTENYNIVYTYNRTLLESINTNTTGSTRLIKNNPITNLTDFRQVLIKDNKLNTSTILSLSPDYSTKNIENRVNLGDPGIRNRDRFNYTSGSSDGPLDKITASPIYKASSHKQDYTGKDPEELNDLVSFRIAIIDNDNPSQYHFIHFRAFIDSFSDSYTAEWGDVKYVGRGEKFYNYNGFDRSISLAFTVPAQSKQELIPMYKKLNYLASSLTPDYNQNNGGFMRGNIAKLTVGGYVYEQPGIIKSLTYDIPSESPWEIALNTNGEIDKSVKELPHIIKVSSFTFVPIHSFLPKFQGDDVNGRARFISLKSGNDNYSDTTNILF
jgi:hypothetical protein